MADSKLSAIGAVGTPSTSDWYYIVQGGTSYKVQHSNVLFQDRDVGGNVVVDGTLTSTGVLTASSTSTLSGAVTMSASASVGTTLTVTGATDQVAVIGLSATTSILEATHSGKTVVTSGTTASTYTLPEATGTGNVYRFICNSVNTNNVIITTADATNADFYGTATMVDLDDNSCSIFAPAATDELITLNGTTTGGAVGDIVEVIDIATDKWFVHAHLQVPTGSNPATPFSGV